MTNEFDILRKSHNIFSLLNKSSNKYIEEIIFIEFRPIWLCSQKKVYKMMQRFNCSICMEDIFIVDKSIQHNTKHPPICKVCYEKLKYCPFCRTPLFILRRIF